MKKSISRQIAFIFGGLVVAIVGITIFLNNQFLSSYYVHHKQESLISVYEKMEVAVAKSGNSYNSMAIELREIIEAGNLHFIIVSGENQSILTSTSNEIQTSAMSQQLRGYLLGKNQDRSALLQASDNYEIRRARNVLDDIEYIEMWGFLSDDSIFLVRSPLESIMESVNLSNRFFLLVMVVMLFLGGLTTWYFSKRIANPILELANLSEKMADLDFNAKYMSGGENEIGVLGRNFNAMSEKLESTISELKRANYELEKDIRKKEEMETMRTEFIGNVSHELKTPIALIQGYAEGLKEGISEDPESRAFYCDVIMDEANKMNHMVKNLLTLNQLEHGEEEVVFERFDVVEMIEGVIQSSEILIQQKAADVRLGAERPTFVWSDEWKVEQVFRNYFSNALNHLDGDKVIDVQVKKNSQNDTVRISVFNTGKQIPEEDIDQIWNKFYKVDKARTREYGGNGIGLSIVKAIMESFHKEYGVQNYKNGVQFWFELDTK